VTPLAEISSKRVQAIQFDRPVMLRQARVDPAGDAQEIP